MNNSTGADLSLWGVHGKPAREVFDEFYDRYLDPMIFMAVKLIDDWQDAEDIVGEGFLKLWKRRLDFPNQAAVYSFLEVTIRNACLNHLRDSGRKQANNEVLIQRLSSHEEYDPESMRIEAEVLREIYREIDQLPEKCRDIFKFSYFEGLGNTAIADKMGITESTVRNQKSRALKLLKSRLSFDAFVILWVSVISIDNQFINFYSN